MKKLQALKLENPENLPCGMYLHYKGGWYLLLGVAQHTERDEVLAVYVSMNASLPGPRIRCRPLKMFTGYTTFRGKKVKRFMYVGNGVK